MVLPIPDTVRGVLEALGFAGAGADSFTEVDDAAGVREFNDFDFGAILVDVQHYLPNRKTNKIHNHLTAGQHSSRK